MRLDARETNPKIRQELQSLGYSNEQVPSGVAESESGVEVVPNEAPVPANAPKVHVARKQQAHTQSTKPASQAAQPSRSTESTPSRDYSTPPPGQMEGLGGPIAVSVGQMDRETWMRREGIQKSGDKIYMMVQAADGAARETRDGT